VAQKAKLESSDDSNWGFNQWLTAKQPNSHARELSEKKKKPRQK